jgi:hypothetical protein
MKLGASILLASALALSGCSSPFEALVPTAYDPVNPHWSNLHVSDLNFTSYDTATSKLSTLVEEYAEHHDYASWGTMIFDIPLVGLAATVAVASANHFATTTVLGIGIASAGTLGARAYMGPTVKAQAYAGAERGLLCLAQTSVQLGGVSQPETQDWINQLNAAAQDPSNASSKDSIAKTAQDLQTAYVALINGPNTLSVNTLAIVQNTTKRAETGIQDITSLLSGIKAPASSGSTKPGGATPAAAPTAGQKLSLSELMSLVTARNAFINSAISAITTCVASSAS